MTAQTRGQAAREAFGELGADWYPGTPWHELHPDLRAQWENAAQAAIDHYNDHRADWPDEGDLAEIATRAVEQEQAAPELAALLAEVLGTFSATSVVGGQLKGDAVSCVGMSDLRRWREQADGLAAQPQPVPEGGINAGIKSGRSSQPALVDSIEDIPAIADAYAAAAELATLRELRAVASHFTETWAELAIALPDDYGCEMNCAEANAAADLYRAFGDDATADSIIAAHAEHDDDEERENHREDGDPHGRIDEPFDTPPAQPAPELDARSFEGMLADPHEQFDQRSELLASIAEYAAAPQSSASTYPSPQPAPEPHRHAFAASDCACDPSCECWQPKAREGS